MKGDAESTPTAEGGQPKMTSQESGYATQRTDKKPRPVCQQTYGGARPKVKHPAESKPKGFTPFALDDTVKGVFFTRLCQIVQQTHADQEPSRLLSQPRMMVHLHDSTTRRTLRNGWTEESN